jgi:hypothetical protein
MSNMIVTGGYGQSAGLAEGGYADIDWSKDQYSITFNIANTHNVVFNIVTNPITFGLTTVNTIFNINTHNETFKIETHDLRFTSKMCI